MELSLQSLEATKAILDMLAFFLAIKYFVHLLPTINTYLLWQKTGYKDLDLDYLSDNPNLLDVAEDVFHSTYPGYVMNRDEMRASFWISIRWKVTEIIVVVLCAALLGYYLLALIVASICIIEVTIFRQGLYAVTEESEDKIKAILGS